MLVLKEKDKQDADWKGVYVVDFHHHIGKNNTVKNLSPAAPDGTYSFLREILFGNQWKPGFFKELAENPDKYKFDVPTEFGEATVASPPVADLLEGVKIDSGQIPGGLENSFAVDQVVAFPMDDTYSEKDIEYYSKQNKHTPKYSLSNSRLSQIVLRFPNSLRFIGFGRVFPEEEGAVEEVGRMVNELGLRGLKLHPKSEFFELEGEAFQEMVRTCGRLKIPIILHTSYLSDVKKIYDSVNDVIREILKDGKRRKLASVIEEIQSINVVIGHCGWHASPDLYNYLSHPNLHGEISGIRSQGVTRFFEAFKENFDMEYFYETTIPEITGRRDKRSRAYKVYAGYQEDRWAEKIMYGSDFPFMDHNQSIDVFASLFSNEFPGTLKDIRLILGETALGLLQRKIPVAPKQKLKTQAYALDPSVMHKDIAHMMMQNLKTGFESVVYNPHLDADGKLDWMGYDILDNKGDIRNIFIKPTHPMKLLDPEAGIENICVDPAQLPPEKLNKPKKLSMKGFSKLVKINKGPSIDFDIG